MASALLSHIEWYLDAAPRLACDVEYIGPLALFITRGFWPYYARPKLGATEPPIARDIELVRRRQRELGMPEAFEWVHETTPAMKEAALAAGLLVQEHPLMVLETLREAHPPPGITLRTLQADAPELAQAHAVAHIAFSTADPATGIRGVEARDARAPQISEPELDHIQTRLQRGLTRMVVALGDEGESNPTLGQGPLSVGSYIPIGSTAEIVGIATLPSARHRGLARAVTTHLIQDALSRGIETILLAAGNEPTANMYQTLGFVRIGTSSIAVT